MAREGEKYEVRVRERKEDLFRNLQGVLVEIGAGAGPNLTLFPENLRVIGIEPNPYMHGYYRDEAREAGCSVSVVQGVAEALPFPDGSIDTVLSTLVLCSVHELDRSLAEIVRVLKPGGRFLFMEHVAAPRRTWLRRIQRWIRPVWSLAGDGCRPDQPTWKHLRSAGFREVEIDHFRVSLPVVSPHIAGVAVK
jgi:ubiquinone/menaquinone biosynthesis C-methylase UbiE